MRDWPEFLVPFDGSRGAEKVLRTACRAARRDGARLTVLLEDPDAEPFPATADCPS